MPGLNKFIRMGGLAPSPPINIWEVLYRGNVDTYPLHMALFLLKNAQGGPGPSRLLPGRRLQLVCGRTFDEVL